MLVLRNNQITIWEQILPKELQVLPEELQRIDELNRLLLEKARDQKLIRSRKLRIDTTVIESDIHHPTDARLMQDSIKVITRTVVNLQINWVLPLQNIWV